MRYKDKLFEYANSLAPNLEIDLKKAQMHISVEAFFLKAVVFSAIFTLNFGVFFFFILLINKMVILIFPILIVMFTAFFLLALKIPKLSMARIRAEIESDIFVPSRMLLTLLESGNSLVTALVNISYSKAKSSKYFGEISSEIFLGKNIEQAIDDAIRFTPSDSFRRVLEPIKKSLRTGADIQNNLSVTLTELAKERIVEIEEYEKKLNPLSMFYMIFGSVIPVLGVVVIIAFLSLIGLNIEFFPFLFLLLILLFMIQLFFINMFQRIRPMVRI